MAATGLDIVTGAFGYSGKYITRRLLAMGRRVKTLTGHPDRPNPFGEEVEVAPFSFDDPAALTESLRGATTLYNTYWVRFPRRGITYELATENSKTLVKAAEEAGVQRIVHVSIANPSKDSPYGYYRGKAIVEEAITSSSLSYVILRPAVFFGGEDVLLNNIAWCLRRFPVFPVPGKGDYKLRPIHVEDFAELAVEAGRRSENVIMDAVGPEAYTFRALARLIARKIGVSVWIVGVPRRVMALAAKAIGPFVRDVILTRDEIDGLMDNLLVSDAEPTGRTCLSQWLNENREFMGRVYASELRRHFR